MCPWHTTNLQSLLRMNFSTLCHFTYSRYVSSITFHAYCYSYSDQKCEDGWREVLVASHIDPTAPIISPSLIDKTPNFYQMLSPAPSVISNLLGASSPRFQKMPVGTRIEVSPSAFKIARRIGELLHSDPESQQSVRGCALIVDYGGDRTFGHSFRVS